MVKNKYYAIFLIICTAILFSIIQCGGDSGSPEKKSESRIVLTGKVSNQTSKADVYADYVYAVNTCPEYGSTWRKKVPFNADGTFSIELSKGDPWIVAFIDSDPNLIGPDKIKGVLRAEELNSVVPKAYDSSESVDAGEITIDEFGNAEVPVETYDTFIGDLGMTTSEANTLGLMDDLMLRYINPDINGNGIIDIDDPDMPEFSLTFWHTYIYGTGLITYIQNGDDLPPDESIEFQGAAPEIRIDKTVSGIYSGVPPKWSLDWTNNGNFVDGPAVWTTGSHGIGVTFDDSDTGLKVMFPSTATDVPDGTYTYELYSAELDPAPTATLTFTNVATMADATLTTNFIFPFPVFNVDGDGDITTIDYTWMKKEVAGFVPATAEDIEMMIGKNCAEIKWYTAYGGDEVGAYITLKPYNDMFAPTGTINFSEATVGASLSPKRADIINLAISFTSKIGLWMKLNITE